MGDSFVKTDMMKYLKDVKQHLGVDKNLSELGLVESEISPLANNASKDACIVTNPKDITSKDIEEIYEQAI